MKKIDVPELEKKGIKPSSRAQVSALPLQESWSLGLSYSYYLTLRKSLSLFPFLLDENKIK